MDKNATFFRKKLIMWYLQNKRTLPWRETKAPYFIWLSEIILQQTRVAQGTPYYLKFIEAFPTIKDLATAPEDEILKLWQGLGYYSRARNLHAAAKHVHFQLNGTFPSTYKELLHLKGVGDYTASAIASICYQEPAAVVDGNVYRVLARVFGIDTPINSTAGIKEFKQLAQLLLDTSQPGTYNQAIMEFGARFCVPQNPDCPKCIFNDTCVAFQQKKVAVLPIKLKKLKVKKRYFNYLVVLTEKNTTFLNQRTQKGIWQQLFEFPLVESLKEVSAAQLQTIEEYKEMAEELYITSVTLYNETSVVHKLSHQHLYTRFWIAEVAATDKNKQHERVEVPFAEIENFAVPVLIENFITSFFNKVAENNKISQ